jgi:hypothetical protein
VIIRALRRGESLDQDGIPITQTIQVDSVRKHGHDDSVIPANVAEAVNFYQAKELIHGCSKLMAADSTRTAVLGNFRWEYQKEPPDCQAYPWCDRLSSRATLPLNAILRFVPS